MAELSTGKSSGISALFSGSFMAMVGVILSIIASPLVLHLLPASIATIIGSISAAYKYWKDQQKQIEVHDTVTVAANNATTAAVAATQIIKNTPPMGSPVVADKKSPLQGGGGL
jgi:hypothetical protein